MGRSGAYGDGFYNTLKLKRGKRFATVNGAVMRSHSMKDEVKSLSMTNNLTVPKRNTHFSPELDHDKRNQKYYRSLFRKKKMLPQTKPKTNA